MHTTTKAITAAVLTAGIAAAAFSPALADVTDDLANSGLVTDVTKTDNPRDWIADLGYSNNVITIITNGTGNNDGQTWATAFTGERPAYLVAYPQSFWPAVPSETASLGHGKYLGIFAPTYTTSLHEGIDNNVAVAQFIHDLPVDDTNDYGYLYIGHSQGAEAVGDAFEQASQDGLYDGTISAALLLSDPRSPWGIKAWAKDDMGAAGAIATYLIGIENNGARNPEDTNGRRLTSVIVVGDSVANMQWNPTRPVSSIIVALSGWTTLHGGPNPWSVLNLDQRTAANTTGLDPMTVLISENGTSYYYIYDAPHPTAILQAQMERDLFGYTDEQFVTRVMELNPKYQAWYPIEKPTVENSAVPVHDPNLPMVTTNTPGSYGVTVPAEIATGQTDNAVAAVPEAEVPTATEPAPEYVAPAPEPEYTEPEYSAPEQTYTAPESEPAPSTDTTDSETTTDSTTTTTDSDTDTADTTSTTTDSSDSTTSDSNSSDSSAAA